VSNVKDPKAKPYKTQRPRVEGMFAILRIREKELMKLQGPCTNDKCRLHKDHAGPCDERKPKE
jgi:hypothetical protein